MISRCRLFRNVPFEHVEDGGVAEPSGDVADCDSASVVEVMKGFGVDSVTHLDYHSAMVGPDGGMKPGISVDGVHPNAQGYAMMTPLAQAAIDKTLGK
jgi:hypothetical protein